MFDRFAICEAYYMFASLYHGGMGSPEYRIFSRLSRIGYRPSPLLTVECMSEEAREILDALVARHGFPPYESEE